MDKTKRNRKKKVIEVILTILGTAVVAITFYVREVKSEYLKSLSEAMAQANQTVLLREDLKEISIKLDRADEDHLPRVASRTQQEKAKKYLNDLTYDAQRRQATREIAIRELEEAKLLAKSAEDATKLKKIDELIKKENEVSNDDLRLFFEIGEAYNPQNKHVESRETYVKRFDSKSENLFKDTAAANKSAHSELVEDLKEISEMAEKANQSYEEYKTWSYRLYSLGFVLGLVGKLVGIGDDDSDE